MAGDEDRDLDFEVEEDEDEESGIEIASTTKDVRMSNPYPIFTSDWVKEQAKLSVYSDWDNRAAEGYKSFRDIYSLDKMETLCDDPDLLEKFFLTGKKGKDSGFCHDLEYNRAYDLFGGVRGGNVYKYYLRCDKDTKQWSVSYNNGNSKKNDKRDISKEEALNLGKKICTALVEGGRAIERCMPKSEREPKRSNYENLKREWDDISEAKSFKGFWDRIWVLKYYHMLFPEYITNFYQDSFVNPVVHFLNLDCTKSESKIFKICEINRFRIGCGLSNALFSEILYQAFFRSPLFCVNLNGRDGIFGEWRDKGVCGVGYKNLGDLNAILKEYVDSDSGRRYEYIKGILSAHYASESQKKRKTRAEDFETLFMPSLVAADKYFVVVSGATILGIGKYKGEIVFDDDGAFGNYAKVDWLDVPKDAKIPTEDDVYDNGGDFYRFSFNKQTSDHINKNIPYLYKLTSECGVATEGEKRSAVDEGAVAPDGGESESEKTHAFATGYERGDAPLNLIVYGAPGTGKSYLVEKRRKALLEHGGDYERVTFYPDYSYANFVGTYKPVPATDKDGVAAKDGEGNDVITYEYVPGPFMRVFARALEDGKKPHLLIVEEINRANAAAVFGDVFQLLDRDESGASEYPIQTSNDMRAYLKKRLGEDVKNFSEIRIPDNMFIWATMNSADQGVYPMDTAFKRRWDFEYIGINGETDGEIEDRAFLNGEVRLGAKGTKWAKWNDLRTAINAKLTALGINEDKQLGPYFVDKKILELDDPEDRSKKFNKVFKDKVLMYLYEDAARQRRKDVFRDVAGGYSYSKIYSDFDTMGADVFCPDIVKDAALHDDGGAVQDAADVEREKGNVARGEGEDNGENDR